MLEKIQAGLGRCIVRNKAKFNGHYVPQLMHKDQLSDVNMNTYQGQQFICRPDSYDDNYSLILVLGLLQKKYWTILAVFGAYVLTK